MSEHVFNRAALRPGLIFGRMSPTAISRAIVLRTAGLPALIAGTAWSHDATLISHNHRWYLGDANMGHNARLTPIEDWELGCREYGQRAIVLWPTGATAEQGQAAAWHWQTHCYGQPYDDLAIKHLAWRWFAEAFGHKLGREDAFYCTESCAASWSAILSPPGSPWWPKVNPTPGTTRKRLLQGKFESCADAFTEFGERFRIKAYSSRSK